MCGRFTIFSPIRELEQRFGVSFADSYEPTFNAAPSQKLPVVLNTNTKQAKTATWGFKPAWAKEETKLLINARAESVDQKPTFKNYWTSC